MAEPAFSTLDPALMADPYPAYDRLRRTQPVFWSREDNAWVLSRHADVAAVMADPAYQVVELAAVVAGLADAAGRPLPDLTSVLKAVLFLRNPPGHGESRRFLVAVMTAQPMSVHRPVIEDVAQTLLRPFVEAGQGDAVTGYADLLPPMFMGRLLGLADDDVDVLVRTVSEVTKSFDRGRSMRFYQRVDQTAAVARAFFLDAISARRRSPREDGLSRMIALSDDRFHLGDDEIASRALFLLIAGVETTSALIASAIRVLLMHPEQAELCRRTAAVLEPAVEEVVRFDGPVQQATRIATRDAVVGGQAVAAGDRLVLLVGAAHRDPDVYPDPDRFDVCRKGPPHLGFGVGLHHCLGASLARLETSIAVSALLALHPTPVCRQADTWWEHRTLRRLKSLPVTLAESSSGIRV